MATKTKGGSQKPKKHVLSEDMAYVLIRMRNGDPLDRREGTRLNFWWTLGTDKGQVKIDDRIATALRERGLIAAKPYKAGAFGVSFALTDEGREVAKTLPAEPDPNYKTPQQRRDEKFKARLDADLKAQIEANRRKIALASAERAVLSAVDDYFKQQGSLEALEMAYLRLRELSPGA